MTTSNGLSALEAGTLKDLLEFSRTAARLVARGRHAYDHDEMLPLAAEAILHRIGEAVTRFPVTFITTHSDVRWRQMRGMRNLIAHEYQAVDSTMMWNALAHELPVDGAAIQAILETDARKRDP